MFHVLGKCKFGNCCCRHHHDILTKAEIATREADKLFECIPFYIDTSAGKDINHVSPTPSPVFQPNNYNGFESQPKSSNMAPWN